MKTLCALHIFFFALSIATAATVQIAWDHAGGATYQIEKFDFVTGGFEAFGESKTLTATVDLEPGDVVAVRAVYAGGFVTDLSDPITILPEDMPLAPLQPPPAKPTGLRVVEIQTSSNLRDWQTIALIPQAPGEIPAEFVRARIATVPR